MWCPDPPLGAKLGTYSRVVRSAPVTEERVSSTHQRRPSWPELPRSGGGRHLGLEVYKANKPSPSHTTHPIHVSVHTYISASMNTYCLRGLQTLCSQFILCSMQPNTGSENSQCLDKCMYTLHSLTRTEMFIGCIIKYPQ